ncbi:GNAT family N-acetyltransferase [uncultured Jatrophihabitans sp.]|uniref:GNAT family N-acetyltransferase n=1 Tax=uncultured Jatrophihabitans sp. TaxID=1610747 RepID=UPI0035CBB1A5
MGNLEPLRSGHAEAVLAFERGNRAYFATSISDRGDAFFEQFAARFQDSLAEQDAGNCAFFVRLDDDGEVIGRFNLYDVANGSAKVGYRVALCAAGQGIATAAVRELCEIASRLGLHTLTSATSRGNIASQKVLTKAGFEPAGEADPSELGGKQGVRYRRGLSAV